MFPRLTGLWRHADFVRLWLGSTVSEFGSLLGALRFVAVVMLGASPLKMGILGAVGVAPGLVFGLAVGVWTDRVRRRPILIISNTASALSLASIPFAFAFDSLYIEHLYVVAFFNGVCKTFFDVSFSAYVPTLVDRGRLVEANSTLAASESVIETCAFSIGGWIVQFATAITAVIVDALSFLVSALLFSRIRTPEPVVEPTTELSSPLREVREGLALALGHPVLRGLTGAAVGEGLIHGMTSAVVLIYGIRELGFSPGVLATIFAAGGVSSFFGSAVCTRITRRFGVGPSMVSGLLLFSLGAVVLVLAQGPMALAGVILVVWQLFDGPYMLYGINEVSLRQAVTPERALGRVNATVRFVGIGVYFVGLLLGGALGEAIGLRQTLLVGVGCGALGAVWLFISPVRKMREIPRESD